MNDIATPSSYAYDYSLVNPICQVQNIPPAAAADKDGRIRAYQKGQNQR
ncbi:MAG: hypothetical protein ACLQVL_21020 [Terriglobia bacterium]